MASTTRSRTSGLTERWLLSTRETVPTATPAERATSRIVRAPERFLLSVCLP
jgi:hypothetical protein